MCSPPTKQPPSASQKRYRAGNKKADESEDLLFLAKYEQSLLKMGIELTSRTSDGSRPEVDRITTRTDGQCRGSAGLRVEQSVAGTW